MALNNRQKTLLELLNQMTQDLVNNNSQDEDLSVDLPGLDIDVDVDIDVGEGGDDTLDSPDTPTTLRDVLLDLVNEQVEITTPFGAVIGTLIAVRTNYVVIIDSTGDTVLVPIEKIEFVSEL